MLNQTASPTSYIYISYVVISKADAGLDSSLVIRADEMQQDRLEIDRWCY